MRLEAAVRLEAAAGAVPDCGDRALPSPLHTARREHSSASLGLRWAGYDTEGYRCYRQTRPGPPNAKGYSETHRIQET